MQALAAKITFGKLRLFVGYSLLPLGILCRLTSGNSNVVLIEVWVFIMDTPSLMRHLWRNFDSPKSKQ